MTEQASSSIVIAADKVAILAVIADFDSYPQWSGYLKSVEVVETGPDGRASTVRFTLDAGIVKDDYTLGYEWSDDEVSWHLLQGRMIKRMDGSYRLVDAGEGTVVHYMLAVDVAIPMLGMLKRKAEQVIMDTALKELKKRVEA